MKIAYLITRMDEYGGAQVHVRDLSLWLKGQGHEISVIAGTSGKITDFLEDQGVAFYEVSSLERAIRPRQDIRAFQEVRKALQKIRPDVLSCHSSKAGLIGRLAAKSLGIPVIFTAHGWAFTGGVPKIQQITYRCLEKFAGPFTDHIITVSEHDRQLGLRAKITKPEKTTAIHNGMPDRPFHSHDFLEAPRLLMVARIGAQKDHETFLKALAKLQDLPWTLSLIGGGDDTELRKLVINLGLDERVKLLGERGDVPEFMEQTDIYCLISNWEGLPRSILEAMRAGLPVVATDVGGTKECVIDGQIGYLVKPRDTEQLTRILRLILPDTKLQKKLGENGRKLFDEKFTFLAMAQKTLDVYRAVDKLRDKPGGH